MYLHKYHESSAASSYYYRFSITLLFSERVKAGSHEPENCTVFHATAFESSGSFYVF